jgi:hypothetical protein
MATRYEYQLIKVVPQSWMETQQALNNMGAAGWIFSGYKDRDGTEYAIWRRPVGDWKKDD